MQKTHDVLFISVVVFSMPWIILEFLLDLTLMRSLLAVAEHGAITPAAVALHLTQPTLSRRIQQLEDELGTSLLLRSRKGVSLTEMGRLVVQEARVLVERWERMQDNLRAHENLDVGLVRVGGGATAVSFLLPEAIADFQRSHPGVRFVVKEAGSREVEADVVGEQLELGIVTLPIHPQWAGEVDVVPLASDHIVAVAATGHPLLSVRRVGVAQLSGQSVVGFEAGSAIRQLIDIALREAGVQMNVLMELRSIPAILQMVLSTRSLAFVSRLSLRQVDSRIEMFEVEGLTIIRELAVISKRDRPLSAGATTFLERLRGK